MSKPKPITLADILRDGQIPHRDDDELTIADIARMLNLNKQTAQRRIDALLASGHATEREATATNERGARYVTTVYRLAPKAKPTKPRKG